MPGQSVGVVATQRAHFDQPLQLRSGGVLPAYDLVYETYGTLNAAKSNAILVCHALSGNHHIAGHYADDPQNIGWWDNIVGPGRPLDTDRFFIVGVNNPGGCHGSTGPSSPNPATGKLWGADFPMVAVIDWVRSNERPEHLWLGGYSFGAFVAWESLAYGADPERIVAHRECPSAVPIACAQVGAGRHVVYGGVPKERIDTHVFAHTHLAAESPKPPLRVFHLKPTPWCCPPSPPRPPPRPP